MGRLIFAIVSTLMEEAVIAVIVLIGLPRIGVRVPLWGLIVLMIVRGAYAVITYRIGSSALRKKQVSGLTEIVGSRGMVVIPLAPEGMVKVQGELWVAKSADGEIKRGENVVVVGQEGLKLIVRVSDSEKASQSGF